ncbi:MAG: class I SAM-dependent methyltransferase [Promethearchaeota archaeon]
MDNEITYLADEEYKNIFIEFCSFRQKIVSKLKDFGLKKSNIILDLAAGHGILSLAIRDSGYEGKLVDIGLINDLESYRRITSNQNRKDANIQYIIMNTSTLAFRDNSFDFIVNFLGLEDINMTLGKKGVKNALIELNRILNKNGILEISIMLKGNEPSSIINWNLWKYIGLNSIFHSPKFYINLLENFGYILQNKFILKTNKKMTEEQAKEEILFACEEAPKIFDNYGVKAKSFEKVWKKLNKRIKKNGVGFYPEILVLIFKKTSKTK